MASIDKYHNVPYQTIDSDEQITHFQTIAQTSNNFFINNYEMISKYYWYIINAVEFQFLVLVSFIFSMLIIHLIN